MAIGRIPEPGTGIPESIIAAKGDLIVGTANDAPGILSVGTNGYTLVADSSVSPQGLKWAVDPVADVVTTAGDLIYGTAADTVTRLGIGTAGQVLRVNSGATAPEWAAAAGGGGKVLQVVSATYSSSLSTSTGSFVDTGLQAIITPTLASSKVLVLMTNQMGATRTGDDCYYKFRLVRGATSIFVGNGNTGFATASVSNAKQIYNTDNASFLDNPATTSATTYKVQIQSVGGSTATAQYNDSASLILLEIGA
jgi:hypothetical protein